MNSETSRDALGRHVEPVLPARRGYTSRLAVGAGTVPQIPTRVGINRGMHLDDDQTYREDSE